MIRVEKIDGKNFWVVYCDGCTKRVVWKEVDELYPSGTLPDPWRCCRLFSSITHYCYQDVCKKYVDMRDDHVVAPDKA